MNNIFLTIFFIDIFLIIMFFALGYFSLDKRYKDIWYNSKTMNIYKLKKLTKIWQGEHYILFFCQKFWYEIYRKNLNLKRIK